MIEYLRIRKEKKNIEALVHIYGKNYLYTQIGELCLEFIKFMEYAKMRLDKMSLQREKRALAENV